MTRKTRKTSLALTGAALLTVAALGSACTTDGKAPQPEESETTAPATTTAYRTVTETATPAATPTYLPDDVSSEYTPDEVAFMRAACDLYDEGYSAVDVLMESFVMPEATPIEDDPERVGELIIKSIPDYCPRHFDEIEKFQNEWA